MCEKNKTWDNSEYKSHSSRHLIKGDNSFFVIGQALPVFQEYSYEGRLLNNYDLTLIPEIKKQIHKYENEQKAPNSHFIMIQDIYYANGRIYILIANDIEQYKCNIICVFDVSKDIKHVKTFFLSEDIYSTFCVFDNQIVAVNYNACIDVFRITEI
jgi:hypothetical protein